MGLGDGAELNRERVPLDVIRLHGGALPSRIIRFRGAGAGKGTEASPHIKQYYISFTVAFILYLYAGSEDGSKTKNPYGKREAQQKHHSEGERGEDPGKTVICRLYTCKWMEICVDFVFACMIWGYLETHFEADADLFKHHTRRV